jgi:hypothetical protein
MRLPLHHAAVWVMLVAGSGFAADWAVQAAADAFNPQGVTIIGMKCRPRPPAGTISSCNAPITQREVRISAVHTHRASTDMRSLNAYQTTNS